MHHPCQVAESDIRIQVDDACADVYESDVVSHLREVRFQKDGTLWGRQELFTLRVENDLSYVSDELMLLADISGGTH